VLALALIVAGCATRETPLAQSDQVEAWGTCDPNPRTAFILVCLKR